MVFRNDRHTDAIRTGSRSFYTASLMLPKPIRDPVHVLYAFCRDADDAVDTRPDAQNALSELNHRLQWVYEGRPMNRPTDRTFADMVAFYEIPKPLPEALIDGFAWDADGRCYAAIEDLRAYAARVAGSVGAMIAVLMGVRESAVVARATELGMAMQLTNIARDVGEDAHQGRLYLPTSWLESEGVDPDAFLANPHATPGLRRTVEHVLNEAERLYQRAEAGIPALPLSCQPGVTAASRLYRAIGHELARQGCDPVSERTVVPAPRKAGWMFDALTGPSPAAHHRAYDTLPETGFLVEAVRS